MHNAGQWQHSYVHKDDEEEDDGEGDDCIINYSGIPLTAKLIRPMVCSFAPCIHSFIQSVSQSSVCLSSDR